VNERIAPTIVDLQREVSSLQSRFPAIAEDHLFVLWFLHAFLVDDETLAADALAGGSGDRGVDAVLLDPSVKRVYIVQGKYHQRLLKHKESHSDVTSFAELGRKVWGPKEELAPLLDGIDPLVEEKLREARKRLVSHGYSLELILVTTGGCSQALRDEAKSLSRAADGPTRFSLIDGRQVIAILEDYLDGVAPPVPMLDLPVEVGRRIQATGVIKRFDPDARIESWVFSMRGSDVGDLYKKAGVRLFARNVRGYLGSTQINEAMQGTIRRRAGYFWYFNNGVTIVCDEAQKIEEHGTEVLRVSNPQIINGQQTTRVLASEDSRASKASVLVRVIRIPRREDGSPRQFDEMVSRIVEATNWQNQIRASDLMANDRQQVFLERALRKLDYQYLRKRQTKREARRSAGKLHRFMIKKEDVAQAVAACAFDPQIVRRGREHLFEELYQEVFASRDANFYLSRFWLMRRVAHGSRGYPERAYAKWLVLHFVWSRIGRDIDGRPTEFRRACERPQAQPRLVRALDQLIRGVFVAASQFYRRERGSGPRALDISTFYQRGKRHEDFARFWRSSNGKKHRDRLRKPEAAFRRLLAEAGEGN
jgi:hypothetical protein